MDWLNAVWAAIGGVGGATAAYYKVKSARAKAKEEEESKREKAFQKSLNQLIDDAEGLIDYHKRAMERMDASELGNLEAKKKTALEAARQKALKTYREEMMK